MAAINNKRIQSENIEANGSRTERLKLVEEREQETNELIDKLKKLSSSGSKIIDQAGLIFLELKNLKDNIGRGGFEKKIIKLKRQIENLRSRIEDAERKAREELTEESDGNGKKVKAGTVRFANAGGAERINVRLPVDRDNSGPTIVDIEYLVATEGSETAEPFGSEEEFMSAREKFVQKYAELKRLGVKIKDAKSANNEKLGDEHAAKMPNLYHAIADLKFMNRALAWFKQKKVKAGANDVARLAEKEKSKLIDRIEDEVAEMLKNEKKEAAKPTAPDLAAPVEVKKPILPATAENGVERSVEKIGDKEVRMKIRRVLHELMDAASTEKTKDLFHAVRRDYFLTMDDIKIPLPNLDTIKKMLLSDVVKILKDNYGGGDSYKEKDAQEAERVFMPIWDKYFGVAGAANVTDNALAADSEEFSNLYLQPTAGKPLTRTEQKQAEQPAQSPEEEKIKIDEAKKVLKESIKNNKELIIKTLEELAQRQDHKDNERLREFIGVLDKKLDDLEKIQKESDLIAFENYYNGAIVPEAEDLLAISDKIAEQKVADEQPSAPVTVEPSEAAAAPAVPTMAETTPAPAVRKTRKGAIVPRFRVQKVETQIKAIKPAMEEPKKKGVFSWLKEKFKGAGEKAREIGSFAISKEGSAFIVDLVYKTASKLIGVKLLTDAVLALGKQGDLYEYVKGRKGTKEEKEDISRLFNEMVVAMRARREERPADKSLNKTKTDRHMIMVNKIDEYKQRIKEAKYVSNREKSELIKKIGLVLKEFAFTEEKAKEERDQGVQDVVGAYVLNKVSGWRVASDGLDLLTVPFGALRMVGYASLATLERIQKGRRQFKKETVGTPERVVKSETRFVVKDLFVNAARETYRGLTMQGAKEGATAVEKKMDLLKSLATLARGVGITMLGLSGGASIKEAGDQFLDAFHKGVGEGALHYADTFSSGAERMMHPIDTMKTAAKKLFGMETEMGPIHAKLANAVHEASAQAELTHVPREIDFNAFAHRNHLSASEAKYLGDLLGEHRALLADENAIKHIMDAGHDKHTLIEQGGARRLAIFEEIKAREGNQAAAKFLSDQKFSSHHLKSLHLSGKEIDWKDIVDKYQSNKPGIRHGLGHALEGKVNTELANAHLAGHGKDLWAEGKVRLYGVDEHSKPILGGEGKAVLVEKTSHTAARVEYHNHRSADDIDVNSDRGHADAHVAADHSVSESPAPKATAVAPKSDMTDIKRMYEVFPEKTTTKVVGEFKPEPLKADTHVGPEPSEVEKHVSVSVPDVKFSTSIFQDLYNQATSGTKINISGDGLNVVKGLLAKIESGLGGANDSNRAQVIEILQGNAAPEDKVGALAHYVADNMHTAVLTPAEHLYLQDNIGGSIRHLTNLKIDGLAGTHVIDVAQNSHSILLKLPNGNNLYVSDPSHQFFIDDNNVLNVKNTTSGAQFPTQISFKDGAVEFKELKK